MSYVGKKIIRELYNEMTISSSNATVKELWVVRSEDGDSVRAELLSTNKTMYSGEGYFRKFYKAALNHSDINGKISLHD